MPSNESLFKMKTLIPRQPSCLSKLLLVLLPPTNYPPTHPPALTEFEQAIPGAAELLPRLGEDGPQPLGNGSGIHGGLEGAEHEVQGSNVLQALLGNLVLQAAQPTLIQDGRYTWTDGEMCYTKLNENNNSISDLYYLPLQHPRPKNSPFLTFHGILEEEVIDVDHRLPVGLLATQCPDPVDQVVDHFVHIAGEDCHVAWSHDQLPEDAAHLQPFLALPAGRRPEATVSDSKGSFIREWWLGQGWPTASRV